VLAFVLREGRNRQIRRMCEAVGLHVRRLVRTAIGPLQMGSLRTGEWQTLSTEALRQLQEAPAHHPKTEPAPPERSRFKRPIVAGSTRACSSLGERPESRARVRTEP
jgi:23S rRNA pseudouridine2605 synthase